MATVPTAKAGIASLMSFHPEFVLAGVYAISTCCVDAIKASKGITSEKSIACGCALILIVGCLVKSKLQFAKDSEEQLFYEFSRTLLTQRRIPFAFILTTTTSSFSIMVSLSILTSTNTKSFPMVSFITF